MSRRSPENYSRSRERLGGEIEQARIFNEDNVEYRVLAPENIVARKLQRVSAFLKGYDLRLPEKESDLKKQLDQWMELRVDAARRLDQLSPQDIAGLRLSADLYDLSALNEYSVLDKTAFSKTCAHWDNIDKKGLVESVIVAYVPQLK